MIEKYTFKSSILISSEMRNVWLSKSFSILIGLFDHPYQLLHLFSRWK